MQLFTQLIAASSAARNFSTTVTANHAAKRTAWYPAFGEMATWSPIG